MSEASDRADAEVLYPDVSRETWARLEAFVALLRRWQPTLNLVAPSTLAAVWLRHVVDSLQLLPLAPDASRWVDLGSGGGFPGLVLAIALADRPVGVAAPLVELVESDRRKAAFLVSAVRETGAAARVHSTRIETWAAGWREPVDVVTARALAPLDRLIPLAFPLLGPTTTAIFPKGRTASDELTAAVRSWHCRHRLVPSLTDSTARIVLLTDLHRRETQEGCPPP